MVKLFLVIFIVLAIFGFEGINCASSQSPPAPSVDCSKITSTSSGCSLTCMSDCVSFLTNGSKITKPEGGCCNGLKSVLKTEADCLCEALKSKGQFGFVLDLKKALSLPSACGVTAPSNITQCATSGGTGAAPAPSPKSSKPESPVDKSGGVASPIGTPAPSHAYSSASSISFATLFFGMVFAAWCSYYY